MFVFGMMIAPLSCFAGGLDDRVVFGEIAWAGSSKSSADEFIELYNPTDKIIDLTGYSIWDEQKINENKETEPELMIKIPDGQIAPKGSFLISNYSTKSDKTVLNIEPDLVNTEVSLSNEKFKISLRNQQDEIIDVAGDGGKPPYYREITSLTDEFGVKSKASIERTILPDGEIATSWAISKSQRNLREASDLMTPENSQRIDLQEFRLDNNSYALESTTKIHFNFKADRPVEKIVVDLISQDIKEQKILKPEERELQLPPSRSCYEIKISFVGGNGLSRNKEVALKCFKKNRHVSFSEVLPVPKERDWNGDGVADSDDEWIELINNSDELYDLIGWQISDASGKVFELNGQILATNYLVFYSDKTGLSLNNTGDELYLFDPSGELMDSVTVPAVKPNYSYAKVGSDWQMTSSPTPGSQNNYIADQLQTELTQKEEGGEDENARVEAVPSTQPEEATGQAVVSTTVTIIPVASSWVEEVDEAYVPKIDGSMVLGEMAYRRSDSFNIWPFLVYFTTVLFLFITSNLIYYGFYRRE